MDRKGVLAVLLCVLSGACLAQVTARRPRVPANSLPGGNSGEKGIFEPVNYGQDINLTDAFFVSPDVGWVSGEHATILKTIDGGATWTAQVGGDASNSDKPIGQLRFLDQNHGWAIQEGPKLLRTLDGQNWEEVNGKFPPGVPVLDYAFSSVRHGILLGGNGDAFYVTNDGGRHWQSVAPCQLRATVQGLAQTPYCHFIRLQMLSPESGVALAWWSGDDGERLVVFRTDDAGAHWNYVVPDVRDSRYADAFFTDLNHGVLIFNNDQKTYVTTDGGRNWRALLSGGIALAGGGSPRFADPEVGWALGHSPVNRDAFRVCFTADGGQHWRNSSDIAFPGNVLTELKFTFPRRDRAFVIGPHGMIYRYRIVPAGYAAAHALPGPLMPGFGALELSAQADAIRRDIEALRSKLPQVAADAGSPGGNDATAASPGANSAPPDASGATDTANGGFSQSADATAPDAAAGQPTGNPLPQDTAGNPTTDGASAQITASGGAASGGFVQDTSPPSAAISDCCAAGLQQLQTDTAGFVAQIPAVTSRYRPLNLIIAGLQLAASLMGQGQSLWSQFRAFKHAPSLQAASQALQQLTVSLNTVQQTSSSGFQNPGGWFAANAPASFVQDVGPGAGLTGTMGGNGMPGLPMTGQNPGFGATPSPPAQNQVSAAPPQTAAQGTPGPAGVPQQTSGQDSLGQAVNKAKQKLNQKIRIPW